MDTQAILEQIRGEIARLQRAERALTETNLDSVQMSMTSVPVQQVTRQTRHVSQEGRDVISIAARLRHTERRAKEHPKDENLKGEIVKLREKLAEAKATKEKQRRDAWWDGRK